VLAVVLAVAGCVIALGACGSGGGSRSSSPSAVRADFLSFSRCMRGHGLSSFPDPGPQGGIQIPIGGGINPASPTFQAAQRACKHALPGGGPPSQIPESQKVQMVKFAECMRAHGVSSYPDPTFHGGGVIQPLSTGIDPNSPSFQKAARSCGNP
jgi:hypothetical protein